MFNEVLKQRNCSIKEIHSFLNTEHKDNKPNFNHFFVCERMPKLLAENSKTPVNHLLNYKSTTKLCKMFNHLINM